MRRHGPVTVRCTDSEDFPTDLSNLCKPVRSVESCSTIIMLDIASVRNAHDECDDQLS